MRQRTLAVVVCGWLALSHLLSGGASAQTTTVRTDKLVVTALPTAAGTSCMAVDNNGVVSKTGSNCATVTSVGLSAPGMFSVSGSPVTTIGTLSFTLATQSANLVFAGPSTGSAAAPTFRSLVKADLPATTVFTDQANTFSASYTQTFSGPIAVNNGIASHLIPSLTDTYDIGSSTKLWNQGYLSQLNAVLFAETTATLFGGWSIIGKNAGTFAARVASTDTTVNFGKTMTPGHFIAIRAHDEGGTLPTAEYLQVGSLVSGTTYNVTRNLSGLGAKNWPSGTSFLVNGTTGDGRIELLAYTTPRISILSQGATYNAQTEQVRIGYLDGMPGVASGKVGIYIGDASKYLSYYDGVLTVRGTLDADDITAGTLSADRIAANSVTTNKLKLVPMAGASLVPDPNFTDPYAWSYGLSMPGDASLFISTITDGKVGVNGFENTGAVRRWFTSTHIPTDLSKTYRLRVWARRTAGSTGGLYVAANMWDSSGTELGAGPWWYYVASNVLPSTTWTEYTATFGAGTTHTIPSNARTMSVGFGTNDGGGDAVMQLQDARIEEMIPASLVVDGSITANKIYIPPYSSNAWNPDNAFKFTTADGGKTGIGAAVTTGGSGFKGLKVYNEYLTSGGDAQSIFETSSCSSGCSVTKTSSIVVQSGASLNWNKIYLTADGIGVTLADFGSGSTRAFLPEQDQVITLGTSTSRFANIHLYLPPASSPNYVVTGHSAGSSDLGYVSGYTGTKTAGACTFTFVTGIVTAVSGC